MRPDQMEIVRAVSVKLDEDTVLVLSYQYHTEKDPDALPHPITGKQPNNRAKSRYRMIGFVAGVKEIKSQVETLRTDAYRTKEWKWPADPNWSGSILYMKDSTNYAFANWLRLKLRKAVSWEDGQRLMRGYKKQTDKGSQDFGKYVVFTPNAVYDMKGYSCQDGSTVDLTDREALLAKKGQTLWKEIQTKLVGREGA